MKKGILSILIVAILLISSVSTVFAIKPDNAAQFINWNLSGAVMPVPPWGLSDIIGSDTASKLIVNQPNGNVEVAVTGVMKGLNPNTTYQVFPSNEWLTCNKWNIVGDWSLRFVIGGNYDHDMTVTFQNMHTGAFSGTGFSTTQTTQKDWDIQGTSEVVGNSITLDLIYTGANAGYTVHAVGEINSAGEIVNGTWSSSGQVGTWSSLAGFAVKETVGCGFPGLLPGQSIFTFMTDEFGDGSWHFNLKNADFPGAGTYYLSVWINRPGATILVSDNFSVVVD